MTDLLAASFAALGAVVGLFVGAIVGSTIWFAVFPRSSDVIPIVVGGLGCAALFSWLGLRVAGRIANRSVRPSS